MVADVGDGMLDEVAAEVIARSSGRRDRPVVLVELGMPLVGERPMEPVPAIETPPEWPVLARARGTIVRGIGEMPLAHGVGPVAMLAQDLGHRRRLACDAALVARKTARPLADDADPDRVRVAPGEQARARGRAHRRNVKVRVAQAARGECVDARRRDLGTVAAEVGEPDVIENDANDVGRARRRGGRFGPPRLRFLPGIADLSAERRLVALRAHLIDFSAFSRNE
jgi:hypothetical protein